MRIFFSLFFRFLAEVIGGSCLGWSSSVSTLTPLMNQVK